MSNKLENLSKELRRLIFKTAYRAKTGHIAPAFSCIDILNVLYFGDVLKHDPKNIQDKKRDRFILSKGHACLALYSVLAQAGYFPKKQLMGFCQSGSTLGGHPKMDDIPGVEASTGALGHGLLFATGIALSGKLDHLDYHTYVLLGDGECQEGSNWEAILFAAQNKLNNLTAIIDYNKLQAMDSLVEIMSLTPLAEKWKSFGWDVIEVDGHDLQELKKILITKSEKPKAVIAHTIKGKGVSFMEGQPLWHIRFPNEEELEILCKELEIKQEELTVL